MFILLDLIIICIISVAVFFSAKHGFVRTVIEVVGGVIVILSVFKLSVYASDFIYDKVIEPSIVSSAQKTAEETAESTVNSVWSAVPDFLKKSYLGQKVTKNGISEKIAESSADSVKSATLVASDKIIKPIITRLISIIISVVLIIVLMFILRLLAKLVNDMFDFGIVGKINLILGGVLGIPKGIIFCFVFVSVIALIMCFAKNGFLFFTEENIIKSYLFKFIYNLLPFTGV